MSEQIARAFIQLRHEMAKGYGLDIAGWDELDDWSRMFHVTVFAAMLDRRDIALGHRAGPRDALPLPAQVRDDVAHVRTYVASLEHLYARAYEDLEGSGQSYEAGGRRVGDLNPVVDHALEARRRGERGDVGRAGRGIGDARNLLQTARRTLLSMVVSHGPKQERERDRIKPDGKAIVSPEQLRESIANQDARARGEKS